jgi:hypothetical protein
MTDRSPKTESPHAADPRGAVPNCGAGPNYERTADGSPMDETDVNLRAHFSRLSAEHLGEYDPAWSDAQMIEWDGNFTSKGCLFLVCSERDVEPAEYRRVLEEHLRLRGLARE